MTNAEKEKVRDELLADEEFMAGLRRGLEARRKGNVIPWEQVAKELGIKS